MLHFFGPLGMGIVAAQGAGGGAPAPGGIAIATPWTIIGDSMTYGDHRAKCYGFWLDYYLSGRLLKPQTLLRGTSSANGWNCGVSGNTSAQIAARAAAFDTHDGIYFLLMGQNDGTGVTAGDQQTNFTTIFSQLSAAERIYVIPFAETTTVFASGTLQARNATNLAWLATVGGNVTLLENSWDGIELHDGAGGAGTHSYDGTHPDVPGARLLAQNIFSEISGDLDPGDVYDLHTALGFATNLYPADFSGTGGSAGAGTSGSVATGLALTQTNATGLTITAGKGTLDGLPSQIITISGDSSTGNIDVTLREASATNTWDINDAVHVCERIKLSAADGISDPVGIQAYGLNTVGARHQWLSHFSPLNEGIPAAFDGIVSGAPEINGAGGTATTFNTDSTIRIQPSFAGVDIRIEINQARVYNQTQELA